MFENRDELPQPFEKQDAPQEAQQDGKLERKADKKAAKKRRRTRRRAAEAAVYTGLGVVTLAEPWLLLLIVPALLLALRD
ncbi:hypothetical protein AB0K43_13355 [Kitasatospora sp. NPDC049258]|uniref:hypothetical protein n=1 Tax=Kitasatospora sp. NPDC049258 TaxID=3155394 RepID=UPI003431F483